MLKFLTFTSKLTELKFSSYLTEVFPGQTDSFRISFVGTLSSTCIVGVGFLVAPLVQIIGHRNSMLIGGVRIHNAVMLLFDKLTKSR